MLRSSKYKYSMVYVPHPEILSAPEKGEISYNGVGESSCISQNLYKGCGSDVPAAGDIGTLKNDFRIGVFD